MPTLVSVDGIDQAISNLACKPNTLKARLLTTIKEYFHDTQSLESLTVIPAEELVAKVWQVDDPDEIKKKKKNLSSLKSSLNKSLKKLTKNDLNPEGIIIGRGNVFEVSAEQKNELLQKMGVKSGEAPAFAEMISALKEALPEMSGSDGAKKLKELFEGLENSKKIIEQLNSRLESQENVLGELNSQLQESRDNVEKAKRGEFDGISDGLSDEKATGVGSDESGDSDDAIKSAGGQQEQDDGLGEAKSTPEKGQGPSTGAESAKEVDEPGYGDKDLESDGGAKKTGIDDDLKEIPEEEIKGEELEEIEVDEDLEETPGEELEEIEVDEDLEDIPEEELEEIEVDEDLEEPPEGELEEIEVDEDLEEPPEGELEEIEVDEDLEEPPEGELEEVDEDLEEIPEEELEEIEVDEDLEEPPEGELEEVDEDLEEIPEGELEEVEVDEDLEEPPEGELEEIEVDEDLEEPPEEELEEIEVDEDLEEPPEGELEEIEVDEDLEEPPEEELEEIEVDEDLEEPPEGELEEIEVDEDLEEPPEGELEEIEVDEDLEEPPEGELEEIEVDEDLEEPPEGELEEIEVDEDFEEIPEGELEEVEVDEDLEEIPEGELEEVEVDEDLEEPPEEELEEVEVDEDLEEIPEEELEEVEVDEDLEEIPEEEIEEVEVDEDLEEIEEKTPKRLIEVLSKYMEPDEAFEEQTDLLSESEEGLVAQLMDRFTPRYIKIPQGEYQIGSAHPKPNEQPLQKVTINSFYIGQYPVTNDIFDLFVRETGYQTDAEKAGFGIVHQGQCVSSTDPQTGRTTLTISRGHTSHSVNGASWRHPNGPGKTLENKANHPVVQVSRKDSQAFASWAGKRLPTEEEWEAGARGEDGRLFPWGNLWVNELCNLASSYIGDTTPVEHFGPKSASPFGLCDLLGNVFEWTSTIHHKINIAGAEKNIYILKGGSWATSGVTSVSHRLLEPDTWSNIIGFRCAV